MAFAQMGRSLTLPAQHKLRDLVEDHQDGFILNRIDFPDSRRYAGRVFASLC